MNHSAIHAHPLFFDDAQKQAIEESLLGLADQISAPLVMLADISGQLITYRGRLSRKQSTGLAALASGSFAAGVEMGNFLGLRGRNRFAQQLHEGAVANLYTISVGSDLLLIVAFTQKTTLALVRFFTQQTRLELLELAEEARRMTKEEVPSGRLEDDFGEALSTQLDDLFGNGLNEEND